MSDSMRHEAYLGGGRTFCRRCGAVEGSEKWADGVCGGWQEPVISTATPMRERLVGVASKTFAEHRGWSGVKEAMVDAIVTELLEPSDGMIGAFRLELTDSCGMATVTVENVRAGIRAMIQHIIDGERQEEPP